MRQVESQYLGASELLDLAAWRRRPAWLRSREGIARLADSLM